jgi:hypothetical protein
LRKCLASPAAATSSTGSGVFVASGQRFTSSTRLCLVVVHTFKSSMWATKVGAQRGCARRDGAASRGAVGPWSRRDLVLGCAGLYRASTRPAVGIRTAQLCGTQKRDMRRRGGVHVPCNRNARRDGRHTDSSCDVGEPWTWGSRSTAREGTAAQAHSPYTKVHVATADPMHGPRMATTALKSMNGSIAPARRGTAVLWCEGRHTGKKNRETRHDTTRASQEGDQGGGKKGTTAVVLTMGRQCRRSWLGEEGLASEVDVHGDGLPRSPLLAPGPCSAPPARRRGGASPLSALTQGKKESKTPMGLVAWAPGVSASPCF